MTKILFQGDSLTDCGRDRTGHNKNALYGYGYVNLIASQLTCDYPGTEVYNRAINGSRIGELYGRWIEDCLNIDCDILSILMGINDIGFAIRMNMGADAEEFEFIYDRLIKEKLDRAPATKIVLCEPFLFKIEENTPEGGKDIVANWDLWNGEMTKRQAVVKRLAEKYNAVFVPFASEFEKAYEKAPPQHWSIDCIHATNAGHQLMARVWLDKIAHSTTFSRSEYTHTPSRLQEAL